MQDSLVVIFFMAALLSLLAAIVALIAPHSFVLRWGKLNTKRRQYGFAFYVCLSVCLLTLSVAIPSASKAALFIAGIAAYGVYIYWLPLRTGIIPNQQLQREHAHNSPQTSPPDTSQNVLPSQILRNKNKAIKNTRKNLPSRIENTGENMRIKLGHKLLGGGIFDIPCDVAELLWFANGPMKNFDEDTVEDTVGNSYDIGDGFSVHMFMTSQIEPSLIDVEMPIKEPKNRMFVEPLGYFPSYAGLNEEQKWGYWNWLCDVDEVTDIGNVFIFYYGLERHLYFGKYKQAADMILRLRAHHTNASFQAYSGGALLASALYHKDLDLYNAAFTDKPNYSELGLFVRFFLNLPISASELMLLSSNFGFTNRRYIKERAEMFSEILSRKMIERFETAFLPFALVDIQHCPLTKVNIAANISLEPRSINVSDITQSPAYKEAGYRLLSETHEEVKARLKEMRKQGIA